MSDDDSYLLPDPPADPDHPWRRLVRLVARLLAEKKVRVSREKPENPSDLEGDKPAELS
jgi:hypothetical protein